jgi:hypothetical protein
LVTIIALSPFAPGLLGRELFQRATEADCVPDAAPAAVLIWKGMLFAIPNTREENL